MKTSAWLLIAAAFPCLLPFAHSQSILNIGAQNVTDGSYSDPANNIDIHPFKGAVMGYGNKVGSMGGSNDTSTVVGVLNMANVNSSLVAGNHNKLAVDADPSDFTTFVRTSGIFGTHHTLLKSSSSSLVSGYSNTLFGSTSLVSGAVNSIGVSTGPPPAIPQTFASYSAAIGIGNKITSETAWVMGRYNTASAKNAVALGVGLTASNDDSSAFGKYNAPMNSGDLLVVGNGADDLSRSTALTIRNDGSIIIPGSVSLGGTTTANSLTVTGDTTFEGITTAENLTVSGNSTLQGSITATNVQATGSATLSEVSATSLSVSGTSTLGTTIASAFTTSSTTTLADTSAQTLTVSGSTTLQGTVTLTQPQGDISMGIYGN